MKGIYTAKKVAEFMVNYANEQGDPISNLQLQKFLYFLWIEYYKENKKYLFDDEFSEWQFGPVIPNVYYQFCVYGGFPITKSFSTQVKEEDSTIIKKFVDKFNKISTYELVDMSHEKGKAWDSVFNEHGNGTGNHKTISYLQIINLECRTK